MFSIIVALTVGLFSLASAQNATTTSSIYSYTITAGSVNPTVSAGWCTSQMNSCNEVCGGRAYPNSCDVASLTYDCTCSSGPTPDLTQYNGTLPFFECQQYVNQCVAANTQDLQKQESCLAIKCGGKSPQAALSAYSSSIAAAESTSVAQSSGMMTTTSNTVSPTAAASPSPTHHNAALSGVDVSTAYSTGAFVAGVFVLVSLVL